MAKMPEELVGARQGALSRGAQEHHSDVFDHRPHGPEGRRGRARRVQPVVARSREGEDRSCRRPIPTSSSSRRPRRWGAISRSRWNARRKPIRSAMNLISIQSHVAYGHVGNSAAVFALQRLGCEVWPVHTVQFSNHTGYGAWRGEVFAAARIGDVVDGIAERGVLGGCDGVLSGYVGAVDTGEAILAAVGKVKAHNANASYCCDPVIGNRVRGEFVRPGVAEFMRDARRAGRAGRHAQPFRTRPARRARYPQRRRHPLGDRRHPRPRAPRRPGHVGALAGDARRPARHHRLRPERASSRAHAAARDAGATAPAISSRRCSSFTICAALRSRTRWRRATSGGVRRVAADP